MTTNYPEKLDPALIGLGRIDKKLLGYLICTDLVPMLEHYMYKYFQNKFKSQVNESGMQ